MRHCCKRCMTFFLKIWVFSSSSFFERVSQRRRNIVDFGIKSENDKCLCLDCCTRDLSQSASEINAGKGGDGRRELADQLVDLGGGPVGSAKQHDLVGLGQWSGDLGSDLGQSVQDEGHDGSVSVLLVGGGL